MSGGTIIVTGGGRGIGAATSLKLAAAGYAIAVNYAADRASALATVAAIEQAGGRAGAFGGDVADPAAVAALFEAAERALGPLTGLVNNAGITGRAARIDAENKTAALADASLRPDITIAKPPGREAVSVRAGRPDARRGPCPFGAVGVYGRRKQEWTAEQFRLAEWLAGQMCPQPGSPAAARGTFAAFYAEQQTIFNSVPAIPGLRIRRTTSSGSIGASHFRRQAVERIEDNSAYELFPDQARIITRTTCGSSARANPSSASWKMMGTAMGRETMGADR